MSVSIELRNGEIVVGNVLVEYSNHMIVEDTDHFIREIRLDEIASYVYL